MNYFVASEIGCFLGFSTNFLPQDNIPVNAEIQSAAEKLDTHSRGDGKVSDF